MIKSEWGRRMLEVYPQLDNNEVIQMEKEILAEFGSIDDFEVRERKPPPIRVLNRAKKKKKVVTRKKLRSFLNERAAARINSKGNK